MAQGDQFFLASATGEKMELTGDVSVGRSTDCDLVVSEGQPSRQHARITVEADGVFVEDLDSTNGTFINGNRIVGAQPFTKFKEIIKYSNLFNF